MNQSGLGTLENAGLIHLAAVQPEVEYIFRHALIQDAAYSSLLKADRRVLHRSAGEALERLYPERLEELADALAYHFGLADAHEKALAYYTQAADRAKRAYANDEAAAFYRASIQQASYLISFSDNWRPQAALLYERLGGVLELKGQLEEAIAAFEEALQYTAETNRLSQARLHHWIGRAWGFRFRHQDAVHAFERAEAALGPAPAEADTEWWQAWIGIQLDRMETQYRQGLWREMDQLIERIQPAMDRYGTPILRFYYYNSLIASEERRNRYLISDRILYHARAMLAAAEQSGDVPLVAIAHFQLGFCLLMHDDFAEAEEELLAAEQMTRQIGSEIYLAYTLTYLSILYRRRGQIEPARAYIRQAEAAVRTNQIGVHLAVAEGNLAWLSLRQQLLAPAYHHGLEAIRLWTEGNFAYPFQWTGYLPLLAVALQQGQLEEAIGYARPLLTPSQARLPDALDQPLAQAVESYEQGQGEQSQSWLQEAVAAAERLGYL
jgi:predicted ATPase